MGKYSNVFQAETYAILRCASILKTLDLPESTIYICSDSQSAIRALHKPKITFKLIKECIQALNELAELRPVC